MPLALVGRFASLLESGTRRVVSDDPGSVLWALDHPSCLEIMARRITEQRGEHDLRGDALHLPVQEVGVVPFLGGEAFEGVRRAAPLPHCENSYRRDSTEGLGVPASTSTDATRLKLPR